ncbi:MAG: peptidoglycan DD-metalloendopeptidase family protein [Bacteroidales bacterium]|nr:peptidoglycan DD-metalloendopeptidase family protein [Bacteroidales bacterium]HOY39575.1 M23 family metallopeptidase [Bacteroidales bacterium]HQP03285.1 M23 family metallopeptidase [Bacteroidales bacterium]
MALRTVSLMICIFSASVLFSQSLVLDTIEVSDSTIVLYRDFTWKYVSAIDNKEVLLLETSDSINLHDAIYEPDSSEVFGTYWDSVELFAYGGMNYSVCNDTLAIPLLQDPFTIPVVGRIYSEFGYRGSRFHNGVDIDLKTGDPVRASFGGKVRKAYYNPGGYGYLIVIRHYNGLETYYAHLSKLLVAEGQWVNSGDTIALGGATGRAYSPHLHWEIRYKDNSFNPRLIADFEHSVSACDTLILKPTDFKHVKDLSEAKYHYIVQGDTLWGLSRRYGVSVSQLCRLNNISETTTLRLGTSLRVR